MKLFVIHLCLSLGLVTYRESLGSIASWEAVQPSPTCSAMVTSLTCSALPYGNHLFTQLLRRYLRNENLSTEVSRDTTQGALLLLHILARNTVPTRCSASTECDDTNGSRGALAAHLEPDRVSLTTTKRRPASCALPHCRRLDTASRLRPPGSQRRLVCVSVKPHSQR